MQSTAESIAASHFSKKIIKLLAKQGLTLNSAFYTGGLNGDTAYVLSDGRARLYLEIVAIAEGKA